MKLQLHVSGLLLLSKCGIAYERRYLRGEKTPTSVQAAIGTAVDRAASSDLRSKINTRSLLPEEEVKDIARDTLVEEWQRGVEQTPEDKEDEIEASRDKAIDRSVKLAGFQHTKLAPNLDPTHVQRSWTLDINGVPIQLAGTIDIQEGLKSIRDIKTSAKSPVRDLADKSLQLTTYALAVYARDKAIPQTVALDYLVMTPKREDKKLVQLESKRTVEDFQPLLQRVLQAQRQIESGIFTPADPNSWACSKRYCGFWDSCPYALRPVTVAAAGVLEGEGGDEGKRAGTDAAN